MAVHKNNKIISNFYLIRENGRATYVGYTNRPVKQRFREHLRDKDFAGDATVEELDSLSFPFTWDINIINQYAQEVSDREASLITECGTGDSIWQKGTSGRVGGQTWADIKHFVSTNRNSPKFASVEETDVVALITYQKKVKHELQGVVSNTISKETQQLKNAIGITIPKENRRLSDVIGSTKHKEHIRLKDVIGHTIPKETQRLKNAIGGTVPKEVQRLKSTIKTTQPVMHIKLKSSINGTIPKESRRLRSIIGGTIPKETQQLKNAIGGTIPKEVRRLKNAINNTRVAEHIRLQSVVNNTHKQN